MASIHSRRRVVATVALGIAVLSGAWTVLLLKVGGIDARILGLRVTSHDPLRPLGLTLASLVVIAVADGLGAIRAARDLPRLLERALARIGDRPLAVVLAIAMVVVGIVWGTKAAGGSDSYGYVSQADLWLRGRLTISQPWMSQVPWPDSAWTFSPLGYRPGQDAKTIVPRYAAGLPMIMALAKAVAGQCGVFLVVPLAGGLLTLATFGIGARLGSSRTGLAGSWLVATSPPVLYMVVQPMSDVPVAAAWAVAFWCLLGDGIGSAAAAGLSATVAVLIRPNLVPMAGIVAVWLAAEVWRAKPADRTRLVWRAAGFIAGVAPAVVIVAVLNQFWYGSPLRSGYDKLSALFDWSNVRANVRNYGSWFVAVQTPVALLGMLALVVPVKWIWPPGARRSVVWLFAAFVLAVWAEYCAYLVFDDWTYLRFLLPCWPIVMIGLAAAIFRPARSGNALVGIAALLLVLGLGWHGITVASRRSAFALRDGERKYAAVGRLVLAQTDPNAVVFSMQHSGSVRYYGGRMTLTFPGLEPTWLDRAVGWLAAHGAHPYAVLEAWEVLEFRERFGQMNALGGLEMTPVAIYSGSTTVYLFDLLQSSSGPGRTPQLITDDRGTVGCVEPATRPTLRFKD